MSQMVKTLIFACVAALVALLAIISYPRQESFQPPDFVGKPLFGDFTDPDAATELKIVKFNEDVGELSEFEVARDVKTSLWVIPSSSDYPADADSQMRDAATALIDLEVLGIASDRVGDHELYGVVEPDKEKLAASQEGVGLLVAVRNSKGKSLASLVIGKQVKGTDGQHFVRIPGAGQNAVYVVKIDPAKFPTEFEKWIEPDLLKMSTFDIEQVTLKDYSILTAKTLTGQTFLEKFDQRFEADLFWNSDKSEWEMKKLTDFRDGKPRETKLLASEELNTSKLNDLKTALGDLKIIGVRRKPESLGGDLKFGDEIMDDADSRASLMSRGFFPVKLGDGPRELRAANGEVLVGMKDGIEYILRFGETARVSQETEEGKLNRYLFVMARRDDTHFKPLELEPFPEGDDESEDAGAKKEEPNPKEEPAKKETETPDKKEGENGEKGDKEAEDVKSDLELERDRINKENQRKKDEREEELKKADQKVAELNSRFADWYYIIAEDEYKKIHLGRNDLIKESDSAKEEGFDIEAFRKLQKDGLKKSDSGSSSSPPMGGGFPGAMPR